MRRTLATGAYALLLAAPRLLFLGLADVLIIPWFLRKKRRFHRVRKPASRVRVFADGVYQCELLRVVEWVQVFAP